MRRENNRGNIRTIRLFIGSFDVRLPITKSLDFPTAIYVRDEVTDAFLMAQKELTEIRTLFNQPIRPHTFISNVREGSIELQVLYNVIADLPWAETLENSELALQQGLRYLKEIGAITAGLHVFKNIGKWISQRLGNREIPLTPDYNIDVSLSTTIEIKEDIIRNGRELNQMFEQLHHEKRPYSLATVVTNHEDLQYIFEKACKAKVGLEGANLGGSNILHDLNMHVNGIQEVEHLKKGDIFTLNNYATLGMQLNVDPDTFYFSAAFERPEIKIESIELSSYETGREDRIFEGGSIDADDLDEG